MTDWVLWTFFGGVTFIAFVVLLHCQTTPDRMPSEEGIRERYEKPGGEPESESWY